MSKFEKTSENDSLVYVAGTIQAKGTLAELSKLCLTVDLFLILLLCASLANATLIESYFEEFSKESLVETLVSDGELWF